MMVGFEKKNFGVMPPVPHQPEDSPETDNGRFFVRRFLPGIALLLLLGIHYFWLERHLGAKEWERVKERLIANGVEIDLEAFAVAMPPPESNFGAAPLIASVVSPLPDGESPNPELYDRFTEMKLPDNRDSDPEKRYIFGDWQSGRRSDLELLAEKIGEEGILKIPETGTPAERILAALQPLEESVAELVRAAKRPHAQLSFETPKEFLPNSELVNFSSDKLHFHGWFQKGRAVACLYAGKPDAALDSILINERMARLAGSHPSILGALVERNLRGSILSVVWEGIELGVWEEQHYRWIEEIIKDSELLERAERAINYEMINWAIQYCDYAKANRSYRSDIASNYWVPPKFWPSGLMDSNKANCCESILDLEILPLRQRKFHSVPNVYDYFGEESTRNCLAHSFYCNGIAWRFGRSEAYRQFVVLACKLERYRMHHNQYPESLAALIPDYLSEIPKDVMKPNHPLKYERYRDKEGYRLCGVGFNGVDDLGFIAWRPHFPYRRDSEKGDWVWSIPAALPPKKEE